MTISECVSDIYLKAVGKATPPAVGSTKYNRIIGLMDFYQRRWAREPGVDWNSLYDPAVSLGTVTATDRFDIDTSTVRRLSAREGDTVRIVWTNDIGYTDYSLIDANKLKDYSFGVTKQSALGNYAAQIGNQLVFNHTFTSSDSVFGGEIFVPAYIYPEEITDDNPDDNEVQVNDPDWLVLRVAAEYVRNDITRRQRYPELLAEANEAMQRMKDENDNTQISTVDTPWTPGINSDSAWD